VKREKERERGEKGEKERVRRERREGVVSKEIQRKKRNEPIRMRFDGDRGGRDGKRQGERERERERERETTSRPLMLVTSLFCKGYKRGSVLLPSYVITFAFFP